MRCASYCTATSYTIPDLVAKLVDSGYEPQYFDDVVHVKKESNIDKEKIDIFYFPFGSVVIWGADVSAENSIREELESISSKIEKDQTEDWIYYSIDEKSERTYIDEEQNEIILNDHDVFLKLSISHALAQSVKLMTLENSVTLLLNKTSNIQKELASKGKVSLSKREISKQIGLLFNEKFLINQHSDILDLPEFFWRRPRYEPLYHVAAEFQDIKVRQEIMNHRLEMVHDLYSILSDERNYIHSTRLEIIIIILITIEVIMGLINSDFLAKITNLFL